MAKSTWIRYTVVATGALAAVLVGGCSALEQSTPEATDSGTANPTAHSSSETSAQGAAGHQTNASGGTGTSPCHTADLTATLGSPREQPTDPQGELGAAGIHRAVDLMWTNDSSRTCTIRGFAGVDLRGADPDTGDGLAYSLPRAGDPHTVTLSPGATARSVIRYIDPRGDEAAKVSHTYWTPEKLVVTPPGETSQLTVDWTAGTPVDNQDKQSGVAAASISPVKTGS